jgi:hypothetical protein
LYFPGITCSVVSFGRSYKGGEEEGGWVWVLNTRGNNREMNEIKEKEKYLSWWQNHSKKEKEKRYKKKRKFWFK